MLLSRAFLEQLLTKFYGKKVQKLSEVFLNFNLRGRVNDMAWSNMAGLRRSVDSHALDRKESRLANVFF